jgi:hypothetical protein
LDIGIKQAVQVRINGPIHPGEIQKRLPIVATVQEGPHNEPVRDMAIGSCVTRIRDAVSLEYTVDSFPTEKLFLYLTSAVGPYTSATHEPADYVRAMIFKESPR